MEKWRRDMAKIRRWYYQPDVFGHLVTRVLHTQLGLPTTVTCAVGALVRKPPPYHFLWDYSLVIHTPDGIPWHTTLGFGWVDDIFRKGLAVTDGALTLEAMKFHKGRDPAPYYCVRRFRPVVTGGCLRFELEETDYSEQEWAELSSK